VLSFLVHLYPWGIYLGVGQWFSSYVPWELFRCGAKFFWNWSFPWFFTIFFQFSNLRMSLECVASRKILRNTSVGPGVGVNRDTHSWFLTPFPIYTVWNFLNCPSESRCVDVTVIRDQSTKPLRHRPTKAHISSKLDSKFLADANFSHPSTAFHLMKHGFSYLNKTFLYFFHIFFLLPFHIPSTYRKSF